MPIYCDHDKNGYYFRYGTHGKKYYFNPMSQISIKRAYNKALKQTRAIHVNK